MNQDLGLRVLGQIMNWSDDHARREFAWLKLMARLTYDGYRHFQAGMRFLESLITWLQQFLPHERETAYALVRRTLVYIGPGEMNRLVERFYPYTVRRRLHHLAAAQCGIPPYRVLADSHARAAERRLRRGTLFMGLSDGARLDTIRRANSARLTNEQFVQGTQIDIDKWNDLLAHLRQDLPNESDARFRLVYLIDDFTATGTSFLRFEQHTAQWKGKLIRFRDSVVRAANALDGDKFFARDWELCVHHHVASSAAATAVTERLAQAKAAGVFSGTWDNDIHASFGTILPPHLPIDAVPGRHDEFIRLHCCPTDLQMKAA